MYKVYCYKHSSKKLKDGEYYSCEKTPFKFHCKKCVRKFLKKNNWEIATCFCCGGRLTDNNFKCALKLLKKKQRKKWIKGIENIHRRVMLDATIYYIEDHKKINYTSTELLSNTTNQDDDKNYCSKCNKKWSRMHTCSKENENF